MLIQIVFKGVRGKEEHAELIKDVRDALGTLLRASSSQAFQEQWEFIQAEYADQRAWLNYMQDEYIKHKERWARAWRLVSLILVYFMFDT